MKPEVDMSVAGLAMAIQKILDESHRILVVSHVDPDGDAWSQGEGCHQRRRSQSRRYSHRLFVPHEMPEGDRTLQ